MNFRVEFLEFLFLTFLLNVEQSWIQSRQFSQHVCAMLGLMEAGFQFLQFGLVIDSGRLTASCSRRLGQAFER